MTRQLIPALMLAGWLLVSSVLAQDATSYDLRPLWAQGQTSRYQIKQTEVTRAEIAAVDQAVDTTTAVEAEVTWEVVDANPDGGGMARMTIDRIELQITDGSGNVTRVSNTGGDPGTESFQTWASALTSNALEVTVDTTGHITNISGHEAIQRQAGPAGEGLGEGYFRDIAMDLAVLVGGSASLKPGATWTHQHESDHRLGTLSYDSTYEFQGVEQMAGVPVALVSRSSRLGFTPDLGELPADAPQVTVNTTEADHQAQILYDLTRHEVVGAHFEQVLGLDVNLSFQGRNLTRTNREVTSTQLLRISEN